MKPSLLLNQVRFPGRGIGTGARSMPAALFEELREILSRCDPKTLEGRRLLAMRATLAIAKHSPHVTKKESNRIYQILAPKEGAKEGER